MSSSNSHRKTKISLPVRRFLTTIMGKSPKPGAARQNVKKSKFQLPVNHTASLLSKGNTIMKSKNRRSLKALIIALLIAFGGGYAIYRNLFTPKVQVQHIARQWLDNSAGKTASHSPRRAVYSGVKHRPARTYGCHIPRYTPKKTFAKQGKKRTHIRGKKRQLAHQRGSHNFYRTGYHGSN
jgi:hypothetical protein